MMNELCEKMVVEIDRGFLVGGFCLKWRYIVLIGFVYWYMVFMSFFSVFIIESIVYMEMIL